MLCAWKNSGTGATCSPRNAERADRRPADGPLKIFKPGCAAASRKRRIPKSSQGCLNDCVRPGYPGGKRSTPRATVSLALKDVHPLPRSVAQPPTFVVGRAISHRHWLACLLALRVVCVSRSRHRLIRDALLEISGGFACPPEVVSPLCLSLSPSPRRATGAGFGYWSRVSGSLKGTGKVPA